MARGKEYGELGKVMDDLARERAVRGPYAVQTYMREQLIAQGRDPDSDGSPDKLPSGQSVWKYYHDRSHAGDQFISLFAELFELTARERGLLAWTYAYGFPAAAGDTGEAVGWYQPFVAVGAA